MKSTKIVVLILSLSALSARAASPGTAPTMVASVNFQSHAPIFEPSAASPDFNVSDDKGVLLTCIAPDLATNADTDRFQSCKLAPGRTLDELMHAIIGTIHSEQAQHDRERAAWLQQIEQMMDAKLGLAKRK